MRVKMIYIEHTTGIVGTDDFEIKLLWQGDKLKEAYRQWELIEISEGELTLMSDVSVHTSMPYIAYRKVAKSLI
jgi:hypothetical protein